MDGRSQNIQHVPTTSTVDKRKLSANAQTQLRSRNHSQTTEGMTINFRQGVEDI